MNILQKYWQQLVSVWTALSPGRRFLLGSTAFVVVAAALGVLYYSYQVEYSELAMNLTPEEAGAITARLKTDSVPYKLAKGGTTILVPADQVQQLRLTMANDGVSSQSSEGYKILDAQSFTTSPSMQNVNLVRAQQGELARSIMKMDAVAAARVHIARPEPSPFIREQKPTTASVIIKLKPGARLSRATAQAITAMVSHAIEGLPADQVTIMDTTGRLLSEQHNGDADGMSNAQLEYRRELESYLSSRAEAMLAPFLGPNKAIVKVSAETSSKLTKEHRESFSAADKVATVETVKNSSSSTGSGARGAAGAASNASRGIAPAGPGGGGKDEETQTTYIVPKITQDIDEKYGTIEHMTVAAVIELPEAVNGKPGVTLEDIREVIKQAIGFKVGRDEIKVASVKLNPPESLEIPNEDAAKLANYQSYVLMARDGAFGVAAVLGVVFGFSLLRRIRPSSRTAQTAEGAASESSKLTAVSPSSLLNPSSQGASEIQINGTSRNGDESLIGEVSLMARENPAMLAKVLSSMMGGTELATQGAGR